MKAIWRGDNVREIEGILTSHIASVYPDGTSLRIVGSGGLDVTVDLGDTVIVRGDSFGIQRAGDPGKQDEVLWTGDNFLAIAKFVERWNMRVEAMGEALSLIAPTGEPFILSRGDKLVSRAGACYVSRAGKDH